MASAHFLRTRDPLDLEVEAGVRVRDLTTLEACETAVAMLREEVGRIQSQIANHENGSYTRSDEWLHKAKAALKWRSQTCKAVNVRADNMRQAESGSAKRSQSITRAIAAHKAAVIADEANFTKSGTAIDDAAAAASEKVEGEAFAAFIGAECRTSADVQAKLDYLLNGTIGERTANVTGLTGEDGESWGMDGAPKALLAFLRSLVVAPAVRGERVS